MQRAACEIPSSCGNGAEEAYRRIGASDVTSSNRNERASAQVNLNAQLRISLARTLVECVALDRPASHGISFCALTFKFVLCICFVLVCKVGIECWPGKYRRLSGRPSWLELSLTNRRSHLSPFVLVLLCMGECALIDGSLAILRVGTRNLPFLLFRRDFDT